MNQSQSLTTEELSEVLLTVLSGTGIAATIIAALIWAVLSPSPLVLLLLVPAAFFVYSYIEGLKVVHS